MFDQFVGTRKYSAQFDRDDEKTGNIKPKMNPNYVSTGMCFNQFSYITE